MGHPGRVVGECVSALPQNIADLQSKDRALLINIQHNFSVISVDAGKAEVADQRMARASVYVLSNSARVAHPSPRMIASWACPSGQRIPASSVGITVGCTRRCFHQSDELTAEMRPYFDLSLASTKVQLLTLARSNYDRAIGPFHTPLLIIAGVSTIPCVTEFRGNDASVRHRLG
jgi:hypothetical protein